MENTKFRNIFIGFRNSSFEKIAELFADKIISEKEKCLFITICDTIGLQIIKFLAIWKN